MAHGKDRLSVGALVSLHMRITLVVGLGANHQILVIRFSAVIYIIYFVVAKIKVACLANLGL